MSEATTGRRVRRCVATGQTIFGIPVFMVDGMPGGEIVIAAPPVEQQVITLTRVGDGTFEARVKSGGTVAR